jgi:hypothetical protein
MPIRESAPLCLTRAFAGGRPKRFGADQAPAIIVHDYAFECKIPPLDMFELDARVVALRYDVQACV